MIKVIKKNFYVNNTVLHKIKSAFAFEELERHHALFRNLPFIEITFISDTKNYNELVFLLDSYKMPLHVLSDKKKIN